MDRIQQINKFIEEMPALPNTVSKIFEVANDAKSTAKDLNDVITLDPVLTGKVLKLINSAYYGVNEEVTSIVKAIIMLGLNTIKNLALSTAVIRNISDSSMFIALNLEGFWRHSIAVGVTAKKVALYSGVDKKIVEEFFIAGLLHDIGKIILNRYFPKLYLDAIKQSDLNKSPLYLEEGKLIHIDHTNVGNLIAKRWNLSEAITEVITKHHTLSEVSDNNKKIVYIVNIANIFANMNNMGFSGDLGKETFRDEVLEFLNISDTALFEILGDIASDVKKAEIFLKLSQEDKT